MASATVTIYRNGDQNYAGKKMVVNRRQIRTMNALLDKVTKHTSMKNAARTIKTPTGGHTIRELDSLETGGCYVAVGSEAFKRLPYLEIKVPDKSSPKKEIEITPVKHSRLQISARARRVADEQPHSHRIIHVFRNGDDLQPSHKMLLDKRELRSMDSVLKVVTSKVHIQTGAVFWLFTVDGKEVKDPSELENGGQYVAVGHGKKFKKVAYSDQGNMLSPRSRAPTKSQLKVAPPRNVKPNKTKNGATKGSKRKTSTTSNSQASSSLSAHDDHSFKRDSLRQEVQDIIQEDVQEEYISQAPPQRSPSPKERVYQASGDDKENAREVQDDKEVKEDKPIDQMPAEEVEEEEIENDNKDKNKESKNVAEKENSGLFGGFIADLIEDVKETFDDDDDEEEKTKEENPAKKDENPSGHENTVVESETNPE